MFVNHEVDYMKGIKWVTQRIIRSRFQENLVAGAYNSMRGLGEIAATVIEEGGIKLGDAIELI